MYCSKCGNQIDESSVFCKYCGAAIAGIEQQPMQSKPFEQSPTHDVIFSKKGLLSFEGRRSRGSYLLVGFMTTLVIKFGDYLTMPKHASNFLLFLGILVVLCGSFISLTNSVKRFHDLNKPTSWGIIPFGITVVAFFIGGTFLLVILFINVFIGLYLLFFKGTEGPNDYGPEPQK